jgi:hypothetical protein
VSIDDVTGGILRDGKAVVGTLGNIFGTIEKIAIAATGLYLLSRKFPDATKAVKESVGAVLREVGKTTPAIQKAVSFVTGQFGKLASTDVGKRIGIALLAPLITKGLLLMGGAAVIAAGGFAKLFLNRSEMATATKDLANALDLTVRAAQGIRAAAEVSRVSLDDVRAAIQHIEQAVSEAVTGSEEYQTAFKALGLTMDQVRKMTPEEIFNRLAKAVQTGAISVGNFSQLLKIMGKDAKSLIPAMKSGFVDISKEMQGLGANRNVIDLLAEADTKIQKIKVSLSGVVGGFTTNLAAAAINLTKRASGFIDLINPLLHLINSPLKRQGFTRFDEFSRKTSEAELFGDEEFGQSKEETSRLEAKLQQRKSIQEVERQELKTIREKNDAHAHEIELEKMSESQRRAALEHDRDALQTQMAATKNAVDRENLNKKLLDVQEKLARHKHTTGFTGENVQSDQFTKIGLFRGGAAMPTRVLAVLNQQASIQREIVNKQVLGLHALDRMIEESRRVSAALEDA